MTEAVKTPPKKRATPKKKSAKKAPAKAVEDFLGLVTPVSDKPKSKRKEKPHRHALAGPVEGEDLSYAQMLDTVINGERLKKSIDRKFADYKSQLLDYILTEYAGTWAAERSKPETTKWIGLRGSFDHIVQGYATFSQTKVDTIQDEMGIKLDPSKDYGLTGVSIDIEKLSKNPTYLKAFQEFLSKLDPSDLDKHVERKISFKKSFYARIGELCGFDPRKIRQMIKIVGLRIQVKNPDSSDSEDSLYDHFKGMKG
jgi:hypothetical protein